MIYIFTWLSSCFVSVCVVLIGSVSLSLCFLQGLSVSVLLYGLSSEADSLNDKTIKKNVIIHNVTTIQFL